jgi:hypothetical protein
MMCSRFVVADGRPYRRSELCGGPDTLATGRRRSYFEKVTLKTVRFITLLLAALTLGMAFSHALEFVPKMR